MKKIKKGISVVFAVLAMALCAGIVTSCDPDDIDAFADGYRDGWNSVH